MSDEKLSAIRERLKRRTYLSADHDTLAQQDYNSAKQDIRVLLAEVERLQHANNSVEGENQTLRAEIMRQRAKIDRLEPHSDWCGGDTPGECECGVDPEGPSGG